MKEECFTCKYFSSAWPMGYCQRNAPQLVETDEEYDLTNRKFKRVARSTFPMVGPADWCGEYKFNQSEDGK